MTPGKARKIFEHGLRRMILVFSPPQIEAELSRVSKEKIEAAVDSGVIFKITGNKHLLGLEEYKKISIIDPTKFILKYVE